MQLINLYARPPLLAKRLILSIGLVACLCLSANAFTGSDSTASDSGKSRTLAQSRLFYEAPSVTTVAEERSAKATSTYAAGSSLRSPISRLYYQPIGSYDPPKTKVNKPKKGGFFQRLFGFNGYSFNRQQRYKAACGNPDEFCYARVKIHHTPIQRYNVPCNPDNLKVTTNFERWGKILKDKLTFKRRNCKINPLFSNIGAGEIIETDKYGRALVVDFQVKKRVFEYIKYEDIYAEKGKHVTRKIRAIRNITLKVTDEDPSFPNGKKGYYLVCLNEAETKEVIIRNLIIKGRIDRLSLVYPEERENLDVWQEKYGSSTIANLNELGPQIGAPPAEATPPAK